MWQEWHEEWHKGKQLIYGRGKRMVDKRREWLVNGHGSRL